MCPDEYPGPSSSPLPSNQVVLITPSSITITGLNMLSTGQGAAAITPVTTGALVVSFKGGVTSNAPLGTSRIGIYRTTAISVPAINVAPPSNDTLIVTVGRPTAGTYGSNVAVIWYDTGLNRQTAYLYYIVLGHTYLSTSSVIMQASSTLQITER